MFTKKEIEYINKIGTDPKSPDSKPSSKALLKGMELARKQENEL